MRRLILIVGFTLVGGVFAIVSLSAAPKQHVVDVRGPTIVAFFPPLTQAQLENDPDTNETLADFQLYARQVREPLKKTGIEFFETYAYSFRIRMGTRVATFRPGKVKVGYYFVAPGKQPRVEYGVLTDADLLKIANDYFGLPAK